MAKESVPISKGLQFLLETHTQTTTKGREGACTLKIKLLTELSKL